MSASNIFDSAAWYLLSYTNTLSFEEWRSTAKQAYQDLEKKYGVASAKDNLAKMVAYYCMEVAPGSAGRKAMSHFRKVHTWGDFRDSDTWWLEEWKARRIFDTEVARVKSECAAIGSIDPSEIQNNYISRGALDIILTEQDRRYQWESHRYLKENLSTIDACFRLSISFFGGTGILDLYDRDILRDRVRIPNLQTSYWVDRVLVEEYGDNIVEVKKREGIDASIR